MRAPVHPCTALPLLDAHQQCLLRFGIACDVGTRALGVTARPRVTVPSLCNDHRMTTLGVVFLPQLAPEQLRDVAQAADEAGLEELWLWEDCFFESGVASASAVLAWSNNVGVGIGLLPAPLRNVALTAMEIATMQRLFPGRVRVAVGHGVQSWMGQVGARAGSPLSLLREYLTALRSLLDGQEATSSGRYVKLDRVQLEWPPLASPELLAGASGPLSLRLSGELADGTVLSGGTSPEGVRRARALIGQGRAASGRSDRHEVVVYLMAATGSGAEDRLLRECQRWGFEPGERTAVAGDADEVARAVGEFARAGAGTVVLQPTADEPDMAGFARFVAQQVRPLVR
jgi:alkanesulfonate monooxygenase SsuD/methylene tetrahydromethanopterin reductase-like flavin-dependent oxidoreductase (luciferase family)